MPLAAQSFEVERTRRLVEVACDLPARKTNGSL
jgi:hypothetical protein